ncbi:MAG: LytTR family DNA-binding domain-containing protein [Bacteroidota bacterium]
MSHKISNIKEGAYMKASESYSFFIKTDGTMQMKTRPIKFFETILLANGWCRIHRSYFVNPSFIEHLSEDRNSICLQNGTYLPISPRNKSVVKKWLRVSLY